MPINCYYSSYELIPLFYSKLVKYYPKWCVTKWWFLMFSKGKN